MVLLIKPLGNLSVDLLNRVICDNTITHELLSPNKNYVMYTFNRNCGATSDDFYNVSIYTNGKELSPRRGNVAYADRPIEAIWKDDNELEIKYSKGIIFYKQEKNLEDIKVTYKEY